MSQLTLSPDPPQAGKSCLVCTNATTPITVKISTAGQPDILLTLTEACNSFTVWPGTKGQTIKFVDQSGQCDSETRTIG